MESLLTRTAFTLLLRRKKMLCLILKVLM